MRIRQIESSMGTFEDLPNETSPVPTDVRGCEMFRIL